MNKKTASKILSEIKKSKNVLLALHVSPDWDGLACVLAMNLVLRRAKKKTKIISYSQIPPEMRNFRGIDKIEIADFGKADLSGFDLFIALDCAGERMITRSRYPKKFPRGFKIINIDHHITNSRFGQINLVERASSVAELLYLLFQSWKMKIDSKLADLLFRGIFSDTGCFQYPNTSPLTLRIAADLLEKADSLNDCVLRGFRSYRLNTLKYWAKVLDNLQLDGSGRFVWSTIGKKEMEELKIDPTEVAGAASLFAPIVTGTEFGIIVHEESDGLVRGSIRSREDFDVSKMAVELGGGGHQRAAGFTLEMPLAEAEKKILKIARKI